MSVQGIHWAQQVCGVGPFKKVILFALGERHNRDSGLCMPDQAMLARDCDMTDRTVRKYVRALEEDGLIERAIRTTPRGRVTHYILHFDRLEPQAAEGVRKDVPDGVRKDIPDGGSGTRVPDGSGTYVPDGSGTCVPVHKEHESTRIYTNPLSDADAPDLGPAKTPSKKSGKRSAPIDDTAVLKAFEEIWALWPIEGRRRSRSKSDVLDLLRKSAKGRNPADLVEAAKRFIASLGKPHYAMALDRWLRQGIWENSMPDAEGLFSERKSAKPEPIDWTKAVARFCQNGEWSDHLGPKPTHPDYRGPAEALEAALAVRRARGIADDNPNSWLMLENINRIRGQAA